jgi:hypothetical protein
VGALSRVSLCYIVRSGDCLWTRSCGLLAVEGNSKHPERVNNVILWGAKSIYLGKSFSCVYRYQGSDHHR